MVLVCDWLVGLVQVIVGCLNLIGYIRKVLLVAIEWEGWVGWVTDLAGLVISGGSGVVVAGVGGVRLVSWLLACWLAGFFQVGVGSKLDL